MMMDDKQQSVVLESTIKCPVCKSEQKLVMPEDYCLWFFDCEKCGEKLKPLPGDCCVFCSYGDVPCPPIQLDKPCC